MSDSRFLTVDNGRSSHRRNRSTTSREIIDYVRAQVFDGTLAAGERINQDALAEEFGVSRLPVREALIALEGEGMVRSELHRGVYVIPIRRVDIEDHYTVYGYIQGLAASRAVDVLTSAQLAELDDLNAAQAKQADLEVVRDLDWQFHSMINRAGGSTKLLSILRHMGRSIPRYLYAMPPTESAQAIVEHNAIVQALRAKDSAAAASRLSAHTVREGMFLAQMLEDKGVLS